MKISRNLGSNFLDFFAIFSATSVWHSSEQLSSILRAQDSRQWWHKVRKWEKRRKEERELEERERESGVFPAHMSFRHPDNLNAWNSLNSSIVWVMSRGYPSFSLRLWSSSFQQLLSLKKYVRLFPLQEITVSIE